LFGHGVLGWIAGGFVVVLSGVVDVAMVTVDDDVPPTWPDGAVPKQLHLDIAVRDVHAAAAEAERLGAQRAAGQDRPEDWLVLFDPAGHPFCFTRMVPQAAFTDRSRSTFGR
jgi:hypothetical protein